MLLKKYKGYTQRSFLFLTENETLDHQKYLICPFIMHGCYILAVWGQISILFLDGLPVHAANQKSPFFCQVSCRSFVLTSTIHMKYGHSRRTVLQSISTPQTRSEAWPSPCYQCAQHVSFAYNLLLWGIRQRSFARRAWEDQVERWSLLIKLSGLFLLLRPFVLGDLQRLTSEFYLEADTTDPKSCSSPELEHDTSPSNHNLFFLS